MKNENPNIRKTPANKSRLLANRRLVFDDFEFYPHQQELRYQGQVCALEPKMLQLLSILISQRPKVVSKEELMANLWPDAVVSDWSLARLVSDTRKLIEDDGKQQSIIRTVRGKGFAFAAQVDEIIQTYETAENSSTPQPRSEHHPSDSRDASSESLDSRATSSRADWKLKQPWKLIVVAVIALLASVLIFQQFFATQSIHDQAEHRLQVMYEVQKNLRLTKTTYLAQKRRRNELKASLLAKSPEKTPLSSERRIRLHYPHLTSQERFIFDQIRAMTEGPMYQGNTQLLKLLNQHPELFREIETFQALYNHLSIWKSKYDRVFVHQPDMCFVFVGEEDGVPFPSEIDDLVDEWIKLNSQPE